MQSLWQDEVAAQYQTPLDLRVYSSRLLGCEPSLVLHGGGNTSVKISAPNLFGQPQDLLYVKGSGWDLATIEAAGFAPVRLDVLLDMARLESLSDTDMVKHQRAAMTDPSAPTPSVEAILHAIIPFKYVDHTHSDAIVTLSNTPNGAQLLDEVFGERVLVIPYVMPGFSLAKMVYAMTQALNWQDIDALILMSHGLFTFNNDAKASYEMTIKLVSKAEHFIEANKRQSFSLGHPLNTPPDSDIDLLELAKIRQLISKAKGAAQLAIINNSTASRWMARQPNIQNIATLGPLTPDHVIRTKRIPVILTDDVETELSEYARQYSDYFQTHQTGQNMLNPAPNFAIWQGKAAISFAPSLSDARIIEDICSHTFDAIMTAEQLSTYQALSAEDIFAVEYWELEQAKLKPTNNPNAATSKPLLGKVAIISSSDSDLSQAHGAHLTALGANIITLANEDIAPFDQCQVAAERAVIEFGGLDMLISLGDSPINQMLFTACEPYLSLGIAPCIICVNHSSLPVLSAENIKLISIQCGHGYNDCDVIRAIDMMLLSTSHNGNTRYITLG